MLVSSRFFPGVFPMPSLFSPSLMTAWRRARRWAAIPMFAVGLAAQPVAAQPAGTAQSIQALPAEVQQAWRAVKLPEDSLSLVVHELEGGRLASINASVSRNPASVMKMVTTWAALSGLGPEYSWRTGFFARSDSGVDAEGTLSGPLYLKAGGDPFLTMQELWSLLRELRLRGVKNLTEVVIDRSRFGEVALDPAAFDGA